MTKLDLSLVVEDQWLTIREALVEAKVDITQELDATFLSNYVPDSKTPINVISLFSFMDLVVPKLTPAQYHYVALTCARRNAINAIKMMEFKECMTVKEALDSYCSQSTQIMTDTTLSIDTFAGNNWFMCARPYSDQPRFLFTESYGLYLYRELVAQFSGIEWKPSQLALRSFNAQHIDDDTSLPSPVVYLGRAFYGFKVENEVLQLPLKLRPYSTTESVFKHTDVNFSVALRYVVLAQLGQEVITLEKLSKVTHLSRRTIQRRLEEAGMNFQSFYEEVIVEEAKRLLVSSRQKVTDISYQLGYSSPPAFTRFFKLKVGLTPKQYQKQHGKHH
ncbi:helix-turn-helix domain-containing protein [Vibrio owensii]|uniref:helix-turn-helix domain-containing protein n=1 Tax=Vibrio owensii TaxID=696485 RepID=UPI004067CC65